MLYDWRFWARDEQVAPEWGWYVWLLMGGRGSGKTRSGAEWVREQIKHTSEIAIIGRTASDVNKTMINGPAGILKVFPPWQKPHHEPTKRQITFHNGAKAHAYTAYEPDELRGPQHGAAWCDELASWRYLQDTWDMLEFGLRQSPTPQIMITTTPRSIPFLKKLLADKENVAVTQGSMYRNIANLPERFVQRIRERYEGTRLADQEIHGRIIDDNPQALWSREDIANYRVTKAPELVMIVVAIDPAASSTASSNDTGIIVAGKGIDGHGYTLDDKTMSAAKPLAWAQEAVTAYYGRQANYIVAEKNNGGDMVESTILTVDNGVPVVLVWASRGKQTRAEPVSSMAAQGKIHHVGQFAELEDQMCHWVPGEGESPDRVDAMVWAFTKLFNLDQKEKEVETHAVVVYDLVQDLIGGTIGAFDGME